jgi:hypothetical protein
MRRRPPARSGAFWQSEWQSNQVDGTDNDTCPVREVLFRSTRSNDKDGLDKPDRPLEPEAQVRVLPGALLCRGRSVTRGAL